MTLKLFVQDADNCKEICRYLDKNITDINKMNVRIKIKKFEKEDFSAEMVEKLKMAKIKSMPTLITPDGKIFTGKKNIIDLFEKNLKKINGGTAGNESMAPVQNTNFGNNPDLASYWEAQLYGNNNGTRVPRNDPEETNDDAADIQRRMDNYRRSVPNHRRPHTERNIDIPQPRRDVQPANDPMHDPQDNIEEPLKIEIKTPQLTGGGKDDQIDQQMLNAWIDNNF